METWQEIPGYPKYEISTEGRVRHRRHKRILTYTYPYNGYPQVKISTDNGQISKCVHHLMAITFMGERPEGHDINHKDKNRANPRLDNLEYITHEQNTQSNRIHPIKYCPVCDRKIPRNHQVTCSKRCNYLLHTVELKCSWCGERFRRWKSTHERAKRDYPNKGELVFCSQDCHGHWAAENFGFGRGLVGWQ